jgi:hypothetical protein
LPQCQEFDALQPTFQGRPGTILCAAQLAVLRRTVAQSPRQAGLLTDTWTGEVVVAFAQYCWMALKCGG